MVYEEKLRQYRFAMRLVTENLTVNQGELDAMKDLYERYPGALDNDVMYTVTGFEELPVLKWLYKSKPILFQQFRLCDERIFVNASLKGANNVVHWIVKLFPDTVRSLVYAARGGHLKLLKWTTKHTKWDENLVAEGLSEAITAVHLDTAEFLHEMKPPKFKLWDVEKESLEMLRWIHDINRWDFKSKVVNDAARNGRLEMLQWLHIHHAELFSTNTMNTAAENEQLNVLKFLHANGKDGCTVEAMNLAAENGYLKVVQWLHENTSGGCTSYAMNLAAKNGHLKVVQWLHSNRTEGCTSDVMTFAAKEGHQDVLKWLHANRDEICT